MLRYRIARCVGSSLRHRHFTRSMGTMSRPAFWKAHSDGSEESIEEEDLYKYTRYRWLRGDAQNLATRYLKFDIDALLAAAVKAVGRPSRHCTKVLKCIEGQYNKALLLTMDNGTEVVARLPNPNAGPDFLTTASEVATRHFLRNVLKIPTPNVFAWSPDPNNVVGAPYIIEGKAHGTQLGNLWQDLPETMQLGIISQIVHIEKTLASVSFPKHGCLYYKADLEKKGYPAESLSPDQLRIDGSEIELDPSKLQGFSLGPLTAGKHWKGGRARMALDRGPWTSTLDYIKALGDNETQYIQSYAKPRMNFSRSLEEPELPSDMLTLLARYMKLGPFLALPTSDPPAWRTLSHPDLHLDNVFIDPTTGNITNIIDWQSASVSDLFWQNHYPLMLTVPAFPEHEHLREDLSGVDTLEGYERRTAELLTHYNRCSRSHNHRRWAASRTKHASILRKPVSLVTGAWDRADIFSFRHALITIVAKWETLIPEPYECPIEFTQHELKLHDEEREVVEVLGSIKHELEDTNFIPLGGRVPREMYAHARDISDHFRDVFVSAAENEEQRKLYPKIWPYDDDLLGLRFCLCLR